MLTAAEMRAAEDRVIASGTSAETLMDRAGTAAAEAAWRFAGPMPALVLCGPGNNGGDGYVIAQRLTERGLPVRVAASAEPLAPSARWAKTLWQGPVEDLSKTEAAPLLIDALFGTGLARPLDESLVRDLQRLAEASAVRVAIDVPSGVATDDGALVSPVPDFDLTIAFAALKPAHLLQPAARHMGRLVIADIGVETSSRLQLIVRPHLAAPGPDDHKYSRGYVAVLAGAMPGAAALAAGAAARAGAGYVRLLSPESVASLPHAIVQSANAALLDDKRIGALVVGPGLGRGDRARTLLRTALASQLPLLLDADALFLLSSDGFEPFGVPAILTPHQGEFDRLFGPSAASKVERTRAAARQSGAVVVFKGSDSVVAAPDGRAAISRPVPHWLASAGTGDVLAGIMAAMLARGLDPFDAAQAGLWLHGEAATRCGPGLIADDLLAHLPALLGECA